MSLLAARGPDAVALVLVGDELLLGHVVDTNAAWLGVRLGAAGLRVVGSAHVADDVAATVRAVRRGLEDAPAVVVTGGLGPTSDDVTRAALAELAGVRLRRDETAVHALSGWYARRDCGVTPDALRMADVPEGAVLLANTLGSAPGVLLDRPDGVVAAVPGVPREMRAMVEDPVLPVLLSRAGALPSTAVRVLRAVGVGESDVAAALADVEDALADDPGADLAYLAAPGVVTVRLTVVRPDAAAAEAALGAYESAVRAALGEWSTGWGLPGPGDGDDPPLPAAVHALLAARGATVAAAESLTGGMVGELLTRTPGASGTFRGAVVAYATELKHLLLGVPEPLLAAAGGAVSERTAAAMARGAVRACGSTYGLATTGVAGPDPREGQPPGTFVVAVAGRGGVRLRHRTVAGERDLVREVAAAAALALLREALLAGDV